MSPPLPHAPDPLPDDAPRRYFCASASSASVGGLRTISSSPSESLGARGRVRRRAVAARHRPQARRQLGGARRALVSQHHVSDARRSPCQNSGIAAHRARCRRGRSRRRWAARRQRRAAVVSRKSMPADSRASQQVCGECAAQKRGMVGGSLWRGDGTRRYSSPSSSSSVSAFTAASARRASPGVLQRLPPIGTPPPHRRRRRPAASAPAARTSSVSEGVPQRQRRRRRRRRRRRPPLLLRRRQRRRRASCAPRNRVAAEDARIRGGKNCESSFVRLRAALNSAVRPRVFPAGCPAVSRQEGPGRRAELASRRPPSGRARRRRRRPRACGCPRDGRRSGPTAAARR